MARKHAAVVCLSGLLAASACASGAAPDPLALYPAGAEGHSALLQGRLELDGSCLYIVGEGGERWLAAFPSPGTEWNAAGRSVRVRESTVPLGERRAFGGGEAATGAASIRWVQPPDASCTGAEKLWLVTGVADG